MRPRRRREKTCINRACAGGIFPGERAVLGLCPSCQAIGRWAFAIGAGLAGIGAALLELLR